MKLFSAGTRRRRKSNAGASAVAVAYRLRRALRSASLTSFSDRREMRRNHANCAWVSAPKPSAMLRKTESIASSSWLRYFQSVAQEGPRVTFSTSARNASASCQTVSWEKCFAPGMAITGASGMPEPNPAPIRRRASNSIRNCEVAPAEVTQIVRCRRAAPMPRSVGGPTREAPALIKRSPLAPTNRPCTDEAKPPRTEATSHPTRRSFLTLLIEQIRARDRRRDDAAVGGEGALTLAERLRGEAAGELGLLQRIQ
jgi:hypothetical protein